MDKLRLLYKDPYYIVVDKPSGVLTIPDGYNQTLPNIKALLASEFERVWTVHRLDKGTSGILFFALTAEAHKLLSIEFSRRGVKKEYIAICHGSLDKLKFLIDLPLLIDGDRKHRTIVDLESGKNSSTEILVKSQNAYYSEVIACPYTGYTHQIRAHLANVGHPIVNDSLYNKNQLPIPNFPSRLMLHAHKISFRHPFTREQLNLTSPLPRDFSLPK